MESNRSVVSFGWWLIWIISLLASHCFQFVSTQSKSNVLVHKQFLLDQQEKNVPSDQSLLVLLPAFLLSLPTQLGTVLFYSLKQSKTKQWIHLLSTHTKYMWRQTRGSHEPVSLNWLLMYILSRAPSMILQTGVKCPYCYKWKTVTTQRTLKIIVSS